MLKTELINCDMPNAQFAHYSVFLQFTKTALSEQKYTGIITTCECIVNFVKVKM